MPLQIREMLIRALIDEEEPATGADEISPEEAVFAGDVKNEELFSSMIDPDELRALIAEVVETVLEEKKER